MPLTYISRSTDFENFYVEVLSTFTSKFGFLNIRDSCESETLHSNCPWHTLQARTLTQCPWPIFHGPLTLKIITSKFGFLDIRDSCESETLHSNCPWHALQARTLTQCPWPIFHGPLTLIIFTSKFRFLDISDSCKSETLHSNCPWHTLQAHTLTRCPWPIFHGPLTLIIFTSKLGFLDISDSCKSETLHSNCPWHTLQARTLTRCPWPIFHGPLTWKIFTSKFDFLDIRDSCESETLHSNCPWHALQARTLTLELYFTVYWLCPMQVRYRPPRSSCGSISRHPISMVVSCLKVASKACVWWHQSIIYPAPCSTLHLSLWHPACLFSTLWHTVYETPVFGLQMHPWCSLVYHFIWTDHGRCMRWTILKYLSPVRGRIKVIRWSLMPYGNPYSLHKANFSFMALLTWASTLGESTAGTNSFSHNLYKLSLTQYSYLLNCD